MEKIAKLYMIFDSLGDIERTGPLLWQINRKRCEDVKNHIFDLLLMSKLLRDKLSDILDFDLIESYIICHDLPEAITGDITKFEGVSDEEVKRVTQIAIEYLSNEFGNILNLEKLLKEYEERSTIEAKVAHMFDKVQSIIPFMKYQIEGNIDLSASNISELLIKHPFVVKEMNEGKDLSDIFYDYHSMAIDISDEECEKYGINRIAANKIILTIKSFIDTLYSQKKNRSIIDFKKDFPKMAMKYNRNTNV